MKYQASFSQKKKKKKKKKKRKKKKEKKIKVSSAIVVICIYTQVLSSILPAYRLVGSIIFLKGVLNRNYHNCIFDCKLHISKQIVQTLMRVLVLRRLIWVYTVCRSPSLGDARHK